MKRIISLLVFCLTGLNISNRMASGTQETTAVSTSLFLIKQNDKYGYIDKTGRIVIAPQFQKADNFSNEFANVQVDGKWGYIDKSGKIVIRPQFDEAKAFNEALAGVKVDGK